MWEERAPGLGRGQSWKAESVTEGVWVSLGIDKDYKYLKSFTV